ncbi:MAG: hypothetical protein OXF07_12710 [Rhodobacter sp.]|nr:hypothetical protein [Rhodobacter sp.]MCY4167468.1 hypothetical protein [Rhodobacter sp.]MCY4241531.1 hypothetical protein [Rhodobacter sp.]
MCRQSARERFQVDMTLIDWLGVLGSLIIAGAYLAVSRGWMAGERPGFNLLNLTGAAFILISLYWRPNVGAILVEALWIMIALQALARYFLRR